MLQLCFPEHQFRAALWHGPYPDQPNVPSFHSWKSWTWNLLAEHWSLMALFSQAAKNAEMRLVLRRGTTLPF